MYQGGPFEKKNTMFSKALRASLKSSWKTVVEDQKYNAKVNASVDLVTGHYVKNNRVTAWGICWHNTFPWNEVEAMWFE